MSSKYSEYFICSICNVRITGHEEGFCFMCLHPLHLNCLSFRISKDQFFDLANKGFKFTCTKCDNILTDVGKSTLGLVANKLVEEAEGKLGLTISTQDNNTDEFIPPPLFVNKGVLYRQSSLSRKHRFIEQIKSNCIQLHSVK